MIWCQLDALAAHNVLELVPRVSTNLEFNHHHFLFPTLYNRYLTAQGYELAAQDKGIHHGRPTREES